MFLSGIKGVRCEDCVQVDAATGAALLACKRLDDLEAEAEL